MSNKISERCWKLQMPMAAKVVLMALADWADDDGHCFPALESISERTCASRRCVIDAIKWLEASGVVSADRSNGRHTKYQVRPDQFAAPTTKSLRPGKPKAAGRPVQIRQKPVQIRQEEGEPTGANSADEDAKSAPVPVQIWQGPVQIRQKTMPNLHTNHQEPPKEPSVEPSIEPSRHGMLFPMVDEGRAPAKVGKRSRSNAPADDFSDLLHGIDPQVLADWKAHRKTRKASISRTVLENLRTESAAAGMTMQDAMVMCITQNWQGFRADWALRRMGADVPAPQSRGGAHYQQRAARVAEAVPALASSAFQRGGRTALPRVFDNVNYEEFPDGISP